MTKKWIELTDELQQLISDVLNVAEENRDHAWRGADYEEARIEREKIEKLRQILLWDEERASP